MAKNLLKLLYYQLSSITVMGPLLLLAYINDIPECISSGSKLRLYADDGLLYRKIRQFSDSAVLQEDLKELQVWECKWLLVKFNPEKCFTLRLTNKTKPINAAYFIHGFSWTLQPTTYRNQSSSSLAIMDQRLHISPTLLNTLVCTSTASFRGTTMLTPSQRKPAALYGS